MVACLTLKHLHEEFRNGCFKEELFARDGVVEIQTESMKRKSTDRVVAVAILNITTNRTT